MGKMGESFFDGLKLFVQQSANLCRRSYKKKVLIHFYLPFLWPILFCSLNNQPFFNHIDFILAQTNNHKEKPIFILFFCCLILSKKIMVKRKKYSGVLVKK